jgi:vanillate O-demethylase ferredoxin subunit
MTISESALQVRLRAITHEAQSILSFELVPLDRNESLPAFSAGAHIDIQLSSGLSRSYSLLNDPQESHRYCIGVNKDLKSRGGSKQMHEKLRPGDILTVSHPKNLFPMNESASFNVFIAGGIGITPLLSMMARSKALGIPWRLHYATRTRAHAGFLDVIASYEGQNGVEIHLNFDQEPGGQMLNLNELIAKMPTGAHVYACGPVPLLEAYEKATAALPPESVHREYFSSIDVPANEGGYSVSLARRHQTIQIIPGQTLLEGLIAAGVEPPYSCQQGVCGTCEVKVLEGIPDHRDLVLTDSEKAANDRMMVCCSGSRSASLVLDL